MYFGASREIIEKARFLRNNLTLAEKRLWEKINNEKIQGLKFRRQHPLKSYIIDFYCVKLKLAIEVDGSNHFKKRQSEYDRERTYELNELGITEIRFNNEEVFKNIDAVINKIEVVVHELLKVTPNPLKEDC